MTNVDHCAQEAERLASAEGLIAMGSLQDGDDAILLLGTGPEFWSRFQISAEYGDAEPHPLDRWSIRVLGAIAQATGAQLRLPFGGPPYAPFIAWAQRTGRAWQSPVGMLVDAQAGMMISYRGALIWSGATLPVDPTTNPCTPCAAPCADACPVDALSANAPYDVAACKAYLETAPGQDCRDNGCKVRRACPVSVQFGRDPAQSAFHMRAFHPT